jgi:U32 family peptidase
LRPGDGLLFEDGGEQNRQQGGRLYEIKKNRLYFQHGKLDFPRIKKGHRLYKTNDPHLDAALQKSFRRELLPHKIPLRLKVSGTAGQPLHLSTIHQGRAISVSSSSPLQEASQRPLTTPFLEAQLGRLGDTPYILEQVENELSGLLIIPVKELNQLRRELVACCLQAEIAAKEKPSPPPPPPLVAAWLTAIPRAHTPPALSEEALFIPLCRTLDQLRMLLSLGATLVYVDLEDIRRYAEAVTMTREYPTARIYCATPRIQKASEQGFFKVIEAAQPDGVLVRNLGALDYFKDSSLARIGDFSLNIANPFTAEILKKEGLERLTVSYDLNAEQVVDLLRTAPAAWFEIVLHQHMPMFHMEHCVFAAFLSEGTDHLTCGRPCDRHELKLKDRVGMEHPVMADVGCRNTVFHGKAQSGALFWDNFRREGAHAFRLEFLRESPEQARLIWQAYHQLLTRELNGEALTRQLRATSQLGVTSGTLTVLG